MDVFIFLIIFSIRAAISILLLFQALLLICTAKRLGNFSIELFQELYQWICFLFWIAISSYIAGSRRVLATAVDDWLENLFALAPVQAYAYVQ